PSGEEPEIEIIEEDDGVVAMDDATRKDTPLPKYGLFGQAVQPRPREDATIEAKSPRKAQPKTREPLPVFEDEPRKPNHGDRGDRTLVRRLVDSVVAALPKSVRKSLSQEIPIGGAAPEKAIDARAWRDLRIAPIFDGLPN